MRSFADVARRWLAVGVAIVGLLAWPAAAPQAAAGPWASGRTVRARLLTATDAAGAGSQIHAGLQVVLDEGWDTYWRSPGDAGAPPQVDWSGSTNVAAVDWRWPAPTRFSQFGIDTFGYLHEVVFPLIVHPKRPGEPIVLRGGADLLVCGKICVPKHLDMSLNLPAGAATADPEAGNLIARFDARVPDHGALSGLALSALAVEPGTPGFLDVSMASRQPLAAPDVIVESPKWSFGEPAFAFGPDRRTATARLPITSGPDAASMPGAEVTATLIDGPRASEAVGTVALGTAVRSHGWTEALLPFLGVALLGGLILNLMPCVLPVLALKLASVLGKQGQARRRVRLGFLATAAGIVASMLALAGVLAGLKAAGVAVGWGIQFQQPIFLVLMTAAIVAFAAGLAGIFEIALPPRLATALARGRGKGLAGDFAAGAFATLLATPCSAPFVGTAVAFALARGPAEILAIFAALGLGLAAPHLVVAAFPGLTRFLPRPGRWMIALRRILAVLLLGTAGWLLAVLAAQTSWQAAGAVGASLVVLAVAPAVRPRAGAPAAAALAVVAMIGAAAPLLLRAAPARAAVTAWVPFDQAGIGRLVAEGKIVFVDVTADWCITCQANKALVIDRPEIAASLAAPNVVPMLADWTRPDARISEYLARNGRFGIPMNAIYGPGAPRGILLSEVLTPAAMLDALRKAGGAQPPAR